MVLRNRKAIQRMVHDPPVEISPSSDGQKAASAYPSQAGSFGKLLRHNPVSLPGHSLKQWGQLGEILGGVDSQSVAPAAVQSAALAQEVVPNRASINFDLM